MPLPTRAHVTIVRNVSNEKRYYDFLGPHGMELEPGQTAAVEGYIFGRHYWTTTSKTNSLIKALVDNHLEILQTPAVYYYGPVDGTPPYKVYMFTAEDNQAKVGNPDYGAYSGPAIPSSL